jgi:phenylpropionate dioxygenase-like ring-hydroxylating dioxygenase large terminal subunit
MALDGGHGSRHGRPAMCGITAEDEVRVYYFVLWPLSFLSIHPDYLLVHRLEPQAPGRTKVVCEWLFEKGTIERPDFDMTEPVEFWDLTNRQDWHVCELQQKGSASRSWVAGRYSNNEPSVQAFDLMVANRYAGDPIVGRPTVREHYGESPNTPANNGHGTDNGHEHLPESEVAHVQRDRKGARQEHHRTTAGR